MIVIKLGYTYNQVRQCIQRINKLWDMCDTLEAFDEIEPAIDREYERLWKMCYLE